MNIQIAVDIAALATSSKDRCLRKVAISQGVSFYRNIPTEDVAWMISIFSIDHKTLDYQICILKNGDIFARRFPYFDGELEGLMLVHNQEQIRDLIKDLLNNGPSVF